VGNQSGVIFGFIVTAFFVYITLKGELPVYAGLLLLSPSQGGSGSAASKVSSDITSTIIQGAILGAA